MATTKLQLGDVVVHIPTGLKGKVKELDGDDVLVKWNGGTLVSPEGENWLDAADLRFYGRR
ncbi:hypothetical protein [Stackebrandtia nassauensis]|uniref:DUF4314 domain-containing protein n=1 Tax=Stackebrandtia nassauensis (strain DSM 44728 / CIP 108903 / NRRL B-16338 / NBRC 102104 / LLR-40K-21) TaxID=446470 RepID=D3Q391_STANL|nr:hypothetical protein [Stackebrandtia nassauensis]ADD40061.1 hypothetical protein Snas_0343 [Stackebrandtia nassauensis DSM 44728]